jgi:hypothetical protein
MKNVVVLFILILLSGCATLRPPTTTIWEPKTEIGKQFRQKYYVNFQNMVNDIRNLKGIGDIQGVLHRGYGLDSNSFYFGVAVGTYTKYNTLRTNFEERSATVVVENGFPILQAIGKQKEPIQDSVVTGVSLSIAWTAVDFSEKYSSGDQEAIIIYITKQLLDEYLSFKITNQELLNRSIVVGHKNGHTVGRIQMNVNKNL